MKKLFPLMIGAVALVLVALIFIKKDGQPAPEQQAEPHAAAPDGVAPAPSKEAAQPVVGAVDPANFVSHQAVYSMRLQSANPSSNIAAVSGEMIYRFADTCDGWTAELGSVLNFTTTTAEQPLISEWSLVSWEAKDASRYRFRMRSSQNGTVTDDLEGEATLNGANGGSVAFTVPEVATASLPAGTMFPTQHTAYMLGAFDAGRRVVTVPIFDGTERDGAMNTSALMLSTVEAGGAANELSDAPMLQGRSWRTQMAFFPMAVGAEAVPTMEMHLRYHENGVAEEVLQDYGDFKIKATLKSLEPLPKPDC